MKGADKGQVFSMCDKPWWDWDADKEVRADGGSGWVQVVVRGAEGWGWGAICVCSLTGTTPTGVQGDRGRACAAEVR